MSCGESWMKRRFASQASAVLYWLLVAFLGLFTTVCATVICAIFVDYGDGGETPFDTPLGPGWICAKSDRFGSSRIVSILDLGWLQFDVYSHSGLPLSDYYREGLEIPDYDRVDAGPVWSRTRSLPGWVLTDGELVLLSDMDIPYIDDARGWPFRALSCRWRTVDYSWQDCEVEWGIELESSPNWSPEFVLRAVPYKPIWRGLIANTVLFAITWLVLFEFTRSVIYRRRLHNGICPKCRYERRGEFDRPCPECGFVCT